MPGRSYEPVPPPRLFFVLCLQIERTRFTLDIDLTERPQFVGYCSERFRTVFENAEGCNANDPILDADILISTLTFDARTTDR